jgi:hypothetical protein
VAGGGGPGAGRQGNSGRTQKGIRGAGGKIRENPGKDGVDCTPDWSTIESLEVRGTQDNERGTTMNATMTTAEARNEMLSAIAKAEAAGVDGHTLDRMRLACEFFTNSAFKTAMVDHVWTMNQKRA